MAATLDAAGLVPLFDTVVTVEDADRSKPAPDLFLVAALRLDVEPTGCLVFEGSREGLEAACLAGMRAIDIATLGPTIA